MSGDEVCQVTVIGGGLVGAATALALLQLGLRVALIEQHPAPPPTAIWDKRIYAISPASETLLDALGVWQGLDPARLQAIYRMDVYGDHDGHLRFDAYESGVGRLATILESGRLQQALWRAIAERDDTVLRVPLTVNTIEWGTPCATLHLSDGSTLCTELVVAADGGHSRVRASAGLHAVLHDYQQQGVVANFECELPHRGTAFQWFGGHASPPLYHGDVFTYLPLAGNRISLVWSTRHGPELLALDEALFTRQVETAGQKRLGRLSMLTPPVAYPLQGVRVPRTVGPGVVLVGDAAHGVHPLAGQGVNLGFGDVAVLREVMAQRGRAHCGDERLLARYARQRAFRVAEMQGMLHGLFYLFDKNIGGKNIGRRLRNTGMNMLDHLGPVKSAMVREATHFSSQEF